MADFRILAKDLCLADGKVDANEVKILKKHLYQDGKIDRKELEFLIDLRSVAQKKKGAGPAFEAFFFAAMYDGVIGNGIISAGEATLLRKAIAADGKVDEGEKKLMKKLKANPRKTDARLDRWYKEVVG